AQDTLFRKARTHNGWQDKDVDDALLHQLHDLSKWGPTSANCCPARFVFVKSKAAKERLKPHLYKGNVEKTMQAPVTVIIGYDLEFYEYLPKLFPHTDARSWFVGKEEKIKDTAFRNGTLQGAYLILAARSLGLDCGPMSGINAKTMKEEFFSGTKVEVNFTCSLGYGDESKLHPHSPRFNFDEDSEIL
ncbi:MAG: malonic semialdehyde reductase, partial [Alphaproteobacteria bacterium]